MKGIYAMHTVIHQSFLVLINQFPWLEKKSRKAVSTIRQETSWPDSWTAYNITRRNDTKSTFDKEKCKLVDRVPANTHVNDFKWKFELRSIEKLFWDVYWYLLAIKYDLIWKSPKNQLKDIKMGKEECVAIYLRNNSRKW